MLLYFLNMQKLKVLFVTGLSKINNFSRVFLKITTMGWTESRLIIYDDRLC